MWTTCRKRVAAILMSLPCNFGSTHAQCAGYQVDYLYGYDCGILGYSGVIFGDINDAGNACGGIGYCGKGADMIIWNGEEILLEVALSLQFNLQALSINEQGDIAGIHKLASGQNRGFVYQDGKYHVLNPLPGHNWSEAYAISKDGTVVGYSNGSPEFWAVTWRNLIPEMLEVPIGPRSLARDISDNSSFICGWMGVFPSPQSGSSAFMWHNGKVTDLGFLPGTTAADARGVNNFGQVCGIASGGAHHAFFWSNGVMQDIGILPGYTQCRALDINDLGQIIGRSEFNSGSGEPFVWHNGTMYALNSLIPPELGLDLANVWSINNAGQIAGHAYDDENNQLGVILTPIPSPVGDFNCDATVNVDDLLGVLNNWAKTSPQGTKWFPPGDFDHNGTVELDDLMIVIDNWS